MRIDIENRNVEIGKILINSLDRQERENNQLQAELEMRTAKYQQEISSMRGKIIPTVNKGKIEELYNKITELV